MDPKLINNIRSILDIMSIKKQLTEYLTSKGIDPGTTVYPPLLQDIQSIGDVSNRIELIPFMEEIDPASGYIRVGWNLFVLGTNKKFLGYTNHKSLNDLNQLEPTEQSKQESLCYTVGKDIIDFIIGTLQKYDDDYTSLGPTNSDAPQTYASKMPVSNAYYQKNKSIGKSI